MARVPILWVAALFLAGLAGCTGSGDPLEEAAPTEPAAAQPAEPSFATGLDQVLNATFRGNATSINDWFFLSTPSGPDRPLQAFSWKVPPGVLRPEYRKAGQGTSLFLEVAPIVPAGSESDLRGWVVAIFVLKDGKPVLAGRVDRSPYHEVGRLGTVQERYDYGVESFLGAAYVGTCCEDAKPGDEIFIIIGADAARPSQFGLGVRILDEDYLYETGDLCGPLGGTGPFGLGCSGRGEPPSRDFAHFLTNVTGPPNAPLRVSNGTGYRLVYYGDYNFFVTGYEAWTEDTTVSGPGGVDVRPAGQSRDLRLGFDHPSTRGWGIGHAYVYSYYGVGQGEWSVDLNVHGMALGDSGAMPIESESWLYRMHGDGPGASSLSMKVADAQVGGAYGVETFHMDFGATLSELIGYADTPTVVTDLGGGPARNRFLAPSAPRLAGGLH